MRCVKNIPCIINTNEYANDYILKCSNFLHLLRKIFLSSYQVIILRPSSLKCNLMFKFAVTDSKLLKKWKRRQNTFHKNKNKVFLVEKFMINSSFNGFRSCI